MSTMNIHPIPNTDKTACSCGGETGSCPCEPGKCGCGNCAKNPDASTTTTSAAEAQLHKVEGSSDKTACNCGGAEGACPCEAGKCACGGCAKNADADVGAKA